MHLGQNIMAETELKHLAATVQQIITPTSNSPIIGMYQDSLLGAYRFTREKIDLTPRQAMNLLMAYKNIDIDALLQLKDNITNFDVLSQIMPHITMTVKNKLIKDDEDYSTSNNVMEIRNGKYIRGQMDKSVLGSTTNGLIHRAFNDFAPERAAEFIDDLQAIVTEYMKTSSYSVGISDLLADKNTMTQITSTIATQKMEAKKLIDSVHLGVFKNETANSNAVEFENQITNIMKKADNDAGKIGSKSLSKNNRFLMIVNSGSKGNMINISQMISCLGQQAVEGKRIPYGLDSRTLPHYFKYDDSPGARGYIENSYISGLTAPELFFHAMGGRIGLIDTAVKSVSWETPIVLIDNGRPLYTEIGRWIDGIIDVSEQVKKYEEKNMELVDIPNGTVFVPTMNEHGEVTWEEITAVTRHDPGNVLYQIKSLGGREVIVTESKSLLIWNKEKGIFEEILTPDIRVGDCLPVTKSLCDIDIGCNAYTENEIKQFHERICDGDSMVFPDDFVLNINNCRLLYDCINLYMNKTVSTCYETYSEKDRNIIGMAFSRLGKFCEFRGNDICMFMSEYETVNNVVLDPIVSITPLSPEKYPKMYDLTIPKTLNFGIANGLQVRDTSSTGYIQRRLIKGLEDLKVEYDMTVRNSNGKIVQFAYGDDGFDSTKVENQQIPLAGMSVEDVYMMYDIARITDKERGSKDIYTPAIVNKIRGEVDETRKMCRKYIDRMLSDREDLVKDVFKYKDDAGVRVPVAFKHLINNVAGSMKLDAHSMVDISPLETFILVETYFQKLEKLHYVRPTNLFRIMYFFYLNPRDLLCVKRYNKTALTVLLETVVLKYKQAVVNPGDMVGVIAGQSIGEPTTQLTLNSFVYETEILVRNAKGEIKCVQIGDFAKWGIDTSRKIEYMDAKDTTYAELCEFYEVPSATEDGRTVWRRIEAVTKHPVINEDGTNTMLKVTTKGQREIIATKAKSFLQLVDGKIVGVNGSELQVGDYLPVSKKPLDFTERKSFDLREILSPKEYIYGTEMEKARSHMHENRWWMKHAGKSFVLPYARSDSAYCALNGGHNKGSKTQFVYKPGCVYTTTNSIGNYEIPETMPLDYDFGYLIGAYCAEGCMTKHQISIANNANEYLAPIERWCAKHNLTTKIYCHKNKIQEGWTSQDIRIYNTVLCRILEKLCGKLSHNKFVSDIIMFSNRECILGFLDAYISGDGCVNKSKDRITDISVGSVSHKMLTQVQVMMKNIGVLGKMYKCTKRESNNRGSKDIKQGFMLRVTNKQAQTLGRLLNLSIDYKRERIAELLTQDFKYEYCGSDLQIPNIINGETIMQARDGRCSDLEFDQIISIEEVPNTTPYAYDLTVEDTRNFDCMNGLCGRDTFHLAGVSSKSNVTRGVPRIEEILNLTKSQKSTSLTVHLKPTDEQHMDRAVKYAKMLEHTKLADVVKSMQICFDPAEDDTRITDDRDFMRQFIEFERMMQECGSETNASEKSKWVLRMEMDEETMLDKNITMDDVHFALKNSVLGEDITCSYSDYNSDKLVFRIRSSTFGQSKKKTKNVAVSLDLSDDISMLRAYQDTILNSVVLRGITGIVNVLPRKLQNMVSKEDGKYSRKDMWVLDTTGTNLLDTLALEYIDSTRTYSNDIKEVFDVLGIDAARQTIFDEMTDVMDASDVYINYHHLSLLCDRMTLTKGMVSIYRTGILSDDVGPIAKSTFEVHTKVLLDAARRAEFDHIRGVSANVMCGQQGLYGTNAFQVVLDMKEMAKLEDKMVNAEEDDVEKMMAKMGLGTADGCVSKIANNIKYLNREQTGRCNDDYDMGF